MDLRDHRGGTELVVLSHLRWDFVWQRPQHLISRLAPRFDRTYFVEEPVLTPAAPSLRLRTVDAGAVTRIWLEIPGPARHCGFGDAAAAPYAELLTDLLQGCAERTAWLYTPMALPLAHVLDPDVVVFDVMDDLASFAHAPEELRDRHAAALGCADVVFTGGRSLQRGVEVHRPDAHCFPSGVEPEHFEGARAHRGHRSRPVAGYVGVIDERLDLDLLADLARELADWELQIVGPVLKIPESSLPQAPNLRYPGPADYADLPKVMGGFDVALMPFALNEATRAISPTKTLEYLAAGLPVVSTRVPDVVGSFSGVVDLRDDGAGFAAGCREVLGHDLHDRDRKLRQLLRWHHWDAIGQRMAELLDTARVGYVEEGQPA